jgi:hypothetical protein
MPYADPEKQKEAKLRSYHNRMKDPKHVKHLRKLKKQQEANRTEEQLQRRREWMAAYKRKRRAAGIDP